MPTKNYNSNSEPNLFEHAQNSTIEDVWNKTNSHMKKHNQNQCSQKSVKKSLQKVSIQTLDRFHVIKKTRRQKNCTKKN